MGKDGVLLYDVVQHKFSLKGKTIWAIIEQRGFVRILEIIL